VSVPCGGTPHRGVLDDATLATPMHMPPRVLCGLLAFVACAGPLNLAGVTSGVRANPAIEALPERAGLAARHASGAALRKDPAVVFADDADAMTAEALTSGLARDRRGAWNNLWDHTWGRVRVARDTPHVHSGVRAFELGIQGRGGAGMSKRFNPGFDRLFLRYYLRYDAAFPGAHHVGGGLEGRAPGVPDATPGIKPDGTNKFTAILDHWAFNASVPPPGHLVTYVYHMDQQHEWGEQFYPSGKTQPGINASRGLFGPSFVSRTDIVPERGRWYCYELMVQLNTPGQRDGRVAFWVDGRLAADFPNLRFRTVDTLKIDRAELSIYESRPMGPQRVWIDDVIVATAYIGPAPERR
jgi:hypothetical protein